MPNLTTHIAIVKDQIDFQAKQALKYSTSPWRKTLHDDSRKKFEDLLEAMIEADKRIDELSNAPSTAMTQQVQQLALTAEDVQGLPAELLAELSVSTSDRTEFDIITLINEAGGILTLDRILIGLFKRTGEIHKRATTTSRLYRMGQKGLLSSVPNRKGLYATAPIKEEDAQTEA